MEDLISIIVPVYNVEKYIEKCLDSIINQTYENLQIILIDDGSSDASGRICDEYAEKDSRIQVIHQENRGVSNARNHGLNLAKGRYIGFCDSDDWIELDMYEYLYDLLKNSACDISTCGVWMECPDKVYEIGFSRKKNQKFNRKNAIVEFHRRKNMSDWMWCKLFSSEILKNITFDEKLKISEDYKFQCDAFEQSQSVICGTEIKYHYVQRKNSVSNNRYTDAFEKGLDVVKMYTDKYIEMYPDSKKEIMIKYMLDSMGNVTTMIKSNSIIQKRLNEIQRNIRKNLWNYLCTNGPELYLKGSAVILSFSFPIFQRVYCRLKKIR